VLLANIELLNPGFMTCGSDQLRIENLALYRKLLIIVLLDEYGVIKFELAKHGSPALSSKMEIPVCSPLRGGIKALVVLYIILR